MSHKEAAGMRRDVDALARGAFDLLVVGGGINGTGVARDAARRGLKVALVEKEDLAYGTTSRSTRLVHGGLRYLEMYDFGLVREALRERKLLLQNAPHLVRPLRFLFPVYKGTVAKSKVRLGLALYDAFASDRRTPSHRWIPREDVLREEPALAEEGLLGAFEYHDSQVSAVERLCVENALDAAAHGAVLANHCEVEEFVVRDGRIAGARVRDRLADRAFEVRAAVTFNATGPWLSVLDVAAEAREGRGRLRMTKGIHLVTPPVVRTALILRAPKDDRTFFAIPWMGHTLIGTTDTDYRGDLDDVAADAEDVRYLVEAAKRFLPGAPVEEVAYTTAGVRSLLNVAGVPEGEVSRKHYVLDHERTDGIPGLVTLVGGKITAFRSVSEDVTDLVLRKLGRGKAKSTTRRAPLPGGGFDDLAALEEAAARDAAPLGIDDASARHLARLYGTRYASVLDVARAEPALARRLCPHAPDVAAEVALAVDREMAVTVADALLRRTTVGLMPCEGKDEALATAVDVMGARLGWSRERREAERRAYLAEIAKRHRHAVAAEPAGGGEMARA